MENGNLYKNLESLIWDYSILKSCVRYYQKHFNCDREVAIDFVKSNLSEYMRKHYEKMFLPQVNKQMEYTK